VTGSERSCNCSAASRARSRFVEGASSGRNNQRAMPAVISSSPGAAEITAGNRLSEVASTPKYRARAQSLSRAFQAITTCKVAHVQEKGTEKDISARLVSACFIAHAARSPDWIRRDRHRALFLHYSTFIFRDHSCRSSILDRNAVRNTRCETYLQQ